MKFKIIFVLIFVIFLSFNINSYEIENHNKQIDIYKSGVLKINDIFTVNNIDSNFLDFNFYNVYDIQINSNRNIDYKIINKKLKISILDYNSNLDDSLNLDIIYLTDSFVKKENDLWMIDFNNNFNSNIESINIFFPKKTIITNASFMYDSIQINNNKFFINLEDINSFNISYKIDSYNLNNFNYNILYYLIGIFVLVLIGFKFYIKKINTKKVNSDLLLGLNENEQKIVKYIMLNQGISQKNLTKNILLSKGTVSKNINKLQSKGYLKIIKYGISNKIYLGEVFDKK
jgi:uncharacterized membrane protein